MWVTALPGSSQIFRVHVSSLVVLRGMGDGCAVKCAYCQNSRINVRILLRLISQFVFYKKIWIPPLQDDESFKASRDNILHHSRLHIHHVHTFSNLLHHRPALPLEER